MLMKSDSERWGYFNGIQSNFIEPYWIDRKMDKNWTLIVPFRRSAWGRIELPSIRLFIHPRYLKEVWLNPDRNSLGSGFVWMFHDGASPPPSKVPPRPSRRYFYSVGLRIRHPAPIGQNQKFQSDFEPPKIWSIKILNRFSKITNPSQSLFPSGSPRHQDISKKFLYGSQAGSPFLIGVEFSQRFFRAGVKIQEGFSEVLELSWVEE